MNKKKIVAAFDFDGTLTRRDTLSSFLWYVAGLVKSSWNFLLALPWITGFVLGIVSRQAAKERILAQFFSGMPIQDVRSLGKAFAEKSMKALLKPGALECVVWHQRQGHRCILISASIDVYLQPWSETAGFDTLICSRLETTDQGIVTGNLAGANCWGPEKVQRLDQVLGPRTNYYLYAYGDSRGDQELLAYADEAYYRCLPTRK